MDDNDTIKRGDAKRELYHEWVESDHDAGVVDYQTALDRVPAAAMKWENGWVSVEDQLPEKDGEYLVWILYDFAEYPQYGIVHFDICAGAFGEFFERFEPGILGYMDDEFLEQKGILAWMPLPDPPSGADMRKEKDDD